MKSRLIITCALLLILASLLGQETKNDENKNIQEIKKTLKVFKEGYSTRDTSMAVEWCNNIFYDDIEILGTYSTQPDGREWFTGKDVAARVIKNDWIGWGDLDANIDDANINYNDDFAWVSFQALVTRSPENSRSRTAEESSGNIFNHFSRLSNDENKTNRLKLMEAAYYANLILYQYEQGEEFVWPIRITGTLQKEQHVWKFRQMHFSHPNRGFPNVRNVDNR